MGKTYLCWFCENIWVGNDKDNICQECFIEGETINLKKEIGVKNE